jgi:hypothetical protein
MHFLKGQKKMDNLDIPTFLRVQGTRQIMVRIPEDSWQAIQAIRSLSERTDGRHATIQAIVCECLRRELPHLHDVAKAVQGGAK